MVSPESILILSRGTDLQGHKLTGGDAGPPARQSVYKYYPEYQQFPLQIFAVQLKEGLAHPRPVTPAYGILTENFWNTLNDIAMGADVTKSLNEAAQATDEAIARNHYFGITPEKK